MGSIAHAKLIIKSYYKLTKKFKNKIDFALKFQYRIQKHLFIKVLLIVMINMLKDLKVPF